MIEQARRALTSKPDVWDEHIGTIIYKGVRKKQRKSIQPFRKASWKIFYRSWKER